MFINKTQEESLTLSLEITHKLTSKTYGYLQLSETEGDFRSSFSANVCKYSLEDTSTPSYSITKTSILYESSSNNIGVVLAFEPERETKYESRHLFENVSYSGLIVFVDPELARVLCPHVDLKKELLILHEKLKEYPFYLQLALVWYCNYLGVEYHTPVLDTTPSCIIHGYEYYKKLVEGDLFTEWVNITIKAITAAL